MEIISEPVTMLAVTSTTKLLVTVNVVTSSLILSTLKMEAIDSSETPVLKRATWFHIPEGDILRSHHRENLKS
jgi:hypothetical protein